MTDSVDSHIAIIGGTGPEGRGLALRWAMSGARVTIGSRSAERAEETAAGIRGQIPGAAVAGATNLEAVAHCDVAVVALPLSALDATLAELADTLKQKLVISVVAALDWIDGRPRPAVIPEGSAAGKIASLLPNSLVTSGFQTLSADKLAHVSSPLEEDCIVCGDDRDARRRTVELARRITGLRAMSGGRLENSYYPEVLVGLLAALNRIHKVEAGVRFVGFDT